MSPPIHPCAVRFLEYLRRHYRNDRGALARLRGGLSNARKPYIWPLLGGFADAIGNEAFETVAALWANSPDETDPDENLGASLKSVASRFNSFEDRFRRVLCCDRREAPSRVAPLVRAAQEKGVRVNYARLLSDLLQWDKGTPIEWAKAFWSAPPEPQVDLDGDPVAGATSP